MDIDNNMITLIGTIHVIDLSKQLVKTFDEIKPDLICVESGKKRYELGRLLERNPKQFKKEKYKYGIPISVIQIQKYEKTLAKKNNAELGKEFKTSVDYAVSHNIPFEFIDIDLEEYIRLWNSASIIERGIIFILLMRYRIKAIIRPNSIIKKSFKEMDKKQKNINKSPRIFIDKINQIRNKHMAKQLEKFNQCYNNIIVIVGNRHVFDISRFLKESGVTLTYIDVKDLMKKNNFLC